MQARRAALRAPGLGVLEERRPGRRAVLSLAVRARHPRLDPRELGALARRRAAPESSARATGGTACARRPAGSCARMASKRLERSMASPTYAAVASSPAAASASVSSVMKFSLTQVARSRATQRPRRWSSTSSTKARASSAVGGQPASSVGRARAGARAATAHGRGAALGDDGDAWPPPQPARTTQTRASAHDEAPGGEGERSERWFDLTGALRYGAPLRGAQPSVAGALADAAKPGYMRARDQPDPDVVPQGPDQGSPRSRTSIRARTRSSAARRFHLETLPGALSEDELAQRIEDVHVLGIRSKTRVTDRVLASARRLLARRAASASAPTRSISRAPTGEASRSSTRRSRTRAASPSSSWPRS